MFLLGGMIGWMHLSKHGKKNVTLWSRSMKKSHIPIVFFLFLLFCQLVATLVFNEKRTFWFIFEYMSEDRPPNGDLRFALCSFGETLFIFHLIDHDLSVWKAMLKFVWNYSITPPPPQMILTKRHKRRQQCKCYGILTDEN